MKLTPVIFAARSKTSSCWRRRNCGRKALNIPERKDYKNAILSSQPGNAKSSFWGGWKLDRNQRERGKSWHQTQTSVFRSFSCEQMLFLDRTIQRPPMRPMRLDRRSTILLWHRAKPQSDLAENVRQGQCTPLLRPSRVNLSSKWFVVCAISIFQELVWSKIPQHLGQMMISTPKCCFQNFELPLAENSFPAICCRFLGFQYRQRFHPPRNSPMWPPKWIDQKHSKTRVPGRYLILRYIKGNGRDYNCGWYSTQIRLTPMCYLAMGEYVAPGHQGTSRHPREFLALVSNDYSTTVVCSGPAKYEFSFGIPSLSRSWRDVYCLLQRKRNAFLVEAHIFGTALPEIFTYCSSYCRWSPPHSHVINPRHKGPPLKLELWLVWGVG